MIPLALTVGLNSSRGGNSYGAVGGAANEVYKGPEGRATVGIPKAATFPSLGVGVDTQTTRFEARVLVARAIGDALTGAIQDHDTSRS